MMPLFARSFPDVAVESLEDASRLALSGPLLENFPAMEALAKQSGMAMDLEPMRKDYERVKNRGTFDYAAPMGDLLLYALPHFIPAEQQTSLP